MPERQSAAEVNALVLAILFWIAGIVVVVLDRGGAWRFGLAALAIPGLLRNPLPTLLHLPRSPIKCDGHVRIARQRADSFGHGRGLQLRYLSLKHRITQRIRPCHTVSAMSFLEGWSFCAAGFTNIPNLRLKRQTRRRKSSQNSVACKFLTSMPASVTLSSGTSRESKPPGPPSACVRKWMRCPVTRRRASFTRR